MTERLLNLKPAGYDRYYLSTEHSASSYGQPVLVDGVDGQAYGPADILRGRDAEVTGEEWVSAGLSYGWFAAEQKELARRFLNMR